MKKSISRRSALGTFAAGGAALATTLGHRFGAADAAMAEELKGHVNHSVCAWCYKGVSLEELCVAAQEIGLSSIELLKPEQWPTIKKYGLTCAMASGAGMGIKKGFNRLENHDALVDDYAAMIPRVADAGLTNLICFSGNREGLGDEEGIQNCAVGLKRLMPVAEKHGVVLVMELLNSKVNHKDYQCDHTAWGAEVCKAVGSDNFKLLYDVYHMQIMEGDLIATIREFAPYIAHYHTGGVPGRNEIDETQEIYYPAVMRAIVETGYTGHVGQEFVPKREDKLASLKQGVEICDV